MRSLHALLLLVVLTACEGSDADAGSRSNTERFPVPDDLVGTKYEMDCGEALSTVSDRDKTIGLSEKFLADPELRPGSRRYIGEKLIGLTLDRALIIAANPSCFSVAQLKEARKITDARTKGI